MKHKIFEYHSDSFPHGGWITETLENLNGTLISHQFIFLPKVEGNFRLRIEEVPAMWILSVMFKEN